MKAFRSIGLEADYYSYSDKINGFSYNEGRKIKLYESKIKIFNKKLVTILNLVIKNSFLFYVAFRYNTFIFIAPHKILQNSFDLKLLRFFGKKK